jgi:hypothetical protein
MWVLSLVIAGLIAGMGFLPSVEMTDRRFLCSEISPFGRNDKLSLAMSL